MKKQKKSLKIILIIEIIILLITICFIGYKKHDQSKPIKFNYENIKESKILKKGLLVKDKNVNLNPFENTSSHDKIKTELFSYLTIPIFPNINDNSIFLGNYIFEKDFEVMNNDNTYQQYNFNDSYEILSKLQSKTFRFKIKDNISFSNKEKITLNHIKFSFEQVQANDKLKQFNLIPHDKKIIINCEKIIYLNTIINEFNKQLILVPIELYKNIIYENISNYGAKDNYFVSYGDYILENWDYNDGIFELKSISNSDNLYSYIKIFLFTNISKIEESFLKCDLTEYEISSPFIIEKITKFENPLYLINYNNSLRNQQDFARMTALYLNYGNDDDLNYSKNSNFRKFLFYAINRSKLYENLKNSKDKKTIIYESPTISFLPNIMNLPKNNEVLYNKHKSHQENIQDFAPSSNGFDFTRAKQIFNDLSLIKDKLKLTLMFPPQDNCKDYELIANILKQQLNEIFNESKLEIEIKQTEHLPSSLNKNSSTYNNTIVINDLKYGINNLPFFTSLDPKEKIPENNPIFNLKLSLKNFDQIKTLQDLEKFLKKYPNDISKEQNLIIYSELEKMCYEKMYNIPLLNKPQKIIISHKNK